MGVCFGWGVDLSTPHPKRVYFCLRTALHDPGFSITHLQEHKTTVTAVSGNRYTVLLSAAIVEELQLMGVCCGWGVDLSTPHPKAHSHQFQLFHDSSRQQYGVTVTRYCSYSCFVLLTMGDRETRIMLSSSQTKINSVTCASCWDLYTRILIKYVNAVLVMHFITLHMFCCQI